MGTRELLASYTLWPPDSHEWCLIISTFNLTLNYHMHSEVYYTTQESSAQQLSFWDIYQGSKKV